MANTATSPNMLLPIPVVGVDPGPDWAANINNCLTLIDQHNHSPGFGVQITPNGLNINSDLSFGGNNAVALRSSRYNVQGSLLAGPLDLGCTYVSGVDLYYNDVNGNHIQITAGGSVNATSSGISSGTASASFSAGVLIVDANVNTPANIRGASILLGNNSAGTGFVTLSPPSSVGTGYTLTLPRIPPSTVSFITMDTSGNMATSVAYPLQGGDMASATITGSNIAAATVTRDNQVAVGQQVSSSCGSFFTSSTSPVNVTNLSVTITTTGRPVIIALQDDGTGTGDGGYVQMTPVTQNSITEGFVYLNRVGRLNPLMKGVIYNNPPPPTGNYNGDTYPASTFWVMDTPAAGGHTYVCQAAAGGLSGGGNITVNNIKLIAYEL